MDAANPPSPAARGLSWSKKVKSSTSKRKEIFNTHKMTFLGDFFTQKLKFLMKYYTGFGFDISIPKWKH
jgi:hypothetical protein